MSSFGTSAINKSGKKLAPKAPARRKPQVSVPAASSSAAASRAGTADEERTEQPSKRQRTEALQNVSETQVALVDPASLLTPPTTQSALPQRAPVTRAGGTIHAASTLDATISKDAAAAHNNEVGEEQPSEAASATAVSSTSQLVPATLELSTGLAEAIARADSGTDAPVNGESSNVNIPSAGVTARAQSNVAESRTASLGAPGGKGTRQSIRGAAVGGAVADPALNPAHPPSPAKKQSTRGRRGKQNEAQTNVAAEPRNAEESTPVIARGATNTRVSRARRAIEAPITSQTSSSPQMTEQTAAIEGDTVQDKPSAKRGRGRRKKVISEAIVRDEDTENCVLDVVAAESTQDVAGQSATRPPKKTRKPRQSRTKKASTEEGNSDEPSASSEQQAAIEQGDDQIEDGSRPSASKKRKRMPTPEDAEAHEVDASTVTMNALTRDSRKGKKSKLESAMQDIDWAEVKRRKEEAEQRAYEHGELERSEQEVNARLDRAGELDASSNAPRTKIVNGQIVIDTSSLVVDRHAAAAADAANQPVEELEEDDITAHVTSHSWVHDSRRDPEERRVMKMKSDPWSETQTNEFYKALSMFGTDFFIISKMFPGKTRRQIKLKFVREERSDPTRINSALLGDDSLPMDINAYATATGRDESYYKDPEVLQQELRDEEQRQKEEIEKQRDEQEQAQREKQRKAAGKTAAAQKERAAKRAGNKKKGKTGPGSAAEGVEVAVEPAPEA